MELKTLKYFISVAETRSFSKTAEQCSVTQPTISQAISRLENEVGFSLFDRSSRPMMLTEAGEFFYARAKKLLKNYEFSVARGWQISEGSPSSLKLLVPSMYEAMLVLEPLRRYQRSRRGLAVGFQTAPSTRIPELLERGKADAAICCSDSVAEHPDLTARRFQEFTYCIAVNEGHPLARLQSVTPDKLSALQCVALQDLTPASENHTRAFCIRVGIDVSAKFRVTDVENLIYQIGLNSSYGLIPDYFRPYLQAGIVCRDIRSDEIPRYQLALCYRRDNRNSALQRLYFRLLEKPETD